MDVTLQSTRPVKVLLKCGSVITGIPLKNRPGGMEPGVWEANIESGNLMVQDDKVTWMIEADSVEAVGQW